MKTYYSKTSTLIVTMFFIALLIPLVIAIVERSWGLMIVLLIAAGFIWYVLTNTFYTIDDNTLIIRSGFVVDDTIDIYKIIAISPTKSLSAAPAHSFDRIALKCEHKDCVVISPERKTDFINDLLAINPNIEVDSRLMVG